MKLKKPKIECFYVKLNEVFAFTMQNVNIEDVDLIYRRQLSLQEI